MKKFAIGCLVILLIGGALLVVGAYLAYQKMAPVVQEARIYVEGLAKLGDLEKQVKNTATFAAPANQELTPVQVERFVRVQESVRKSLGQRFDEIEAKYRHLKPDTPDTSRTPSFGELMTALSEISSVFVQARQFQVNALNAEGFSQSEYSWVRARVYQAAGVEATTTIDFSKIQEAIRKGTGTTVTLPETNLSSAPARTRELVKPHLRKMDDWLPLAFFGL